MNQVLICKDVVYAKKTGSTPITGVDELNLLAQGALAVFNDKNELLTAANAATKVVDAKYVWMACGTASGVTRTLPIYRRNVQEVNSKAYAAPVKQKTYLGTDGTAGDAFGGTVTAGESTCVKLIDTTIPSISQETSMERYEYYHETGDAIVDVVNGIVAAINARITAGTTNLIDSVAIINTDDGISITMKTGKIVEIAMDGAFKGEYILYPDVDGTVLATAMYNGNGTPTQLIALEEFCRAEEGKSNNLWLPQKYFSAVSEVDTTASYMVWNIVHALVNKQQPGNYETTADQHLTIAIPNAAATVPLATINTIFAQAFNSADMDFEAGS